MSAPYTDIDTADGYNTSSGWTSATDAQKTNAILMASYWIDDNYSCTFENPVQDEIQAATSLLAEQYILGTLFTPRTDAVTKKTVKAGSVTTSKEYASGDMSVQQFPEVQLYLSAAYCTVVSPLNIRLVRT